MKIAQNTRTKIYTDHIMMSKLCDLLSLSPNDIKNLSFEDSEVWEREDVLNIIDARNS